MSFLHQSLYRARISSWCHFWPVFLIISASRSRCQVFYDLPLFIRLWGFHLIRYLVVLVDDFCNMLPIHLKRRWRMSISAGFCFVRYHRTLLLIVSGHRILRIFLRYKLLKVWIFLVVFALVLHVSVPYNNTDFTFMLKSLIFVLHDRYMAAQIFFRSMKAVLSLLILIFTSA